MAELVVHGENPDTQPRTLVVRVDDKPSPPYADRANEERRVSPGPFTLRLRLAALCTPHGRPLDIYQTLNVIAFAPDGGLKIDPLTVEQPASLPNGTFGWYFGPADLTPLQGMRAVGTSDLAVSGPALQFIHRTNLDPVLAWGMQLTRFETDLPPGKWHLTLWTEAPGDWETLPVLLERRIRINGTDIVLERQSNVEWVNNRYLAGRDMEADPALLPFAALGARRGGLVDADVTLPNGHLVLELAGAGAPTGPRGGGAGYDRPRRHRDLARNAAPRPSRRRPHHRRGGTATTPCCSGANGAGGVPRPISPA